MKLICVIHRDPNKFLNGTWVPQIRGVYWPVHSQVLVHPHLLVHTHTKQYKYTDPQIQRYANTQIHRFTDTYRASPLPKKKREQGHFGDILISRDRIYRE